MGLPKWTMCLKEEEEGLHQNETHVTMESEADVMWPEVRMLVTTGR